MVLTCKIQGQRATFLVDAGATVSMVSKELYNRLPIEVRPPLFLVNAACGLTYVKPIGWGNFNIDNEHGNMCVGTMLVADLPSQRYEGIIGMDLLLKL